MSYRHAYISVHACPLAHTYCLALGMYMPAFVYVHPVRQVLLALAVGASGLGAPLPLQVLEAFLMKPVILDVIHTYPFPIC
eukprot:2016606-Heterocapsa_arctica.AAC.1